MTTKRTDNPYDLCQFQFANGKCCGMPAHPNYNGLCLNHGTIHMRTAAREDDLYNELASPSGAFLSQAEINQALGKLFEALAANRISTRRAATFGYLAQLLLQVHAGLQADARMVELQGAKDLHMLLKMKYGPALRKEAEKKQTPPTAPAPATPSRSTHHSDTPTAPKSI
ncbi:MAG TPA: hypothetical protein VKA02_02160 [Candidatus Acidoferrum sp.]|nr:hypothetical protein [Candidatus Acidoferrum sp.]